MKSNNNIKYKITYEKVFWLFTVCSVIGVILEGVFCLLSKGAWESHVLTLIGHFNALYGAGAVIFYVVATLLKNRNIIIRAIVIMLLATLLELLSGLLLEDVLGMKAWDYSNSFLNFRGIICPTFSCGWGFAGLLFCVAYEKIDSILCKASGKSWRLVCVVLSVFMGLNLLFTAAAIERWSSRHYGFEATNAVQRIIDDYTPDDWMQERFVEWSFPE